MDLKTYKLPMQIAVALSTGRPELLRLGSVQLEPETQTEMLRLLCDLLAEREAQKDKLNILEQTLEETVRTITGNVAKLARTFFAFKELETQDEMVPRLARKED